MNRKLIMVLVGMATMASMVLAPNAIAALTKPRNQIIITRSKAACRVLGTVVITPGVLATTGNRNYYLFAASSILCVWTLPALKGRKTYSVNARGCTDGPAALGETAALGWSARLGCGRTYTTGAWDNGGCGKAANRNLNKGNILVRGLGQSASGWVKFTRVGTAVKAWGKLVWLTGGKKTLCFTAQLQFTPTGTLRPTRTARLDGAAQIGNLWILDPKNAA
jgi:hypothetical protein